jgi:hypothetical protein
MLELKEKKDLFSIVVFFCYYGSSEIKIVMKIEKCLSMGRITNEIGC